jgi:hypothetical protein
MAEEEFTIRFLREAQIERAYAKEERKGGFWIERIPVGTIKRVRRRSLEFWRARGLDMIEIVPDAVAPAESAPKRRAVVADSPSPVAVWDDERKAQMRRAIDAFTAGAGDFKAVLALDPASIPDISPQLVEVLLSPFCSADDVRALRALVRGRPGRRARHGS